MKTSYWVRTKTGDPSTPQRGATLLLLLLSLTALSACNLVQSATRYVTGRFAASPLTTVADVPLQGNPDRFDYQSIDSKTGWLFISHLGSGQVHVFDTASGKIKSVIGNLAGAHGVLAVPALRRVYVAAAGTHELAVIDADSLKLLARVPAGEGPDGMAYAPEAHAIFVSNEGGPKESVIDTRTNRRIAEIDLGGEGGNTQYDPVTRHIFVNVEPRDQIAEIDPLSLKILAWHPVPGVGGAHGLLLDSNNRQAYVASKAGSRVALVDMNTWQVLDLQPVGAFPDVLALDAAQGFVYVAAESGTVTVFKTGQTKLVKQTEGFVAPHAHSIAVDPLTHKLYLPLQNIEGKPVLRIASYSPKP